MRIADAMISLLYNNGLHCAFGIPTAQISGFNDGLNDSPMAYIVVKNEAAATFAAGRYADLTRSLSGCFIGGCVGVSNGMNGIADAYRNKLPLIIVSSYVNTPLQGKNALQELITTDMTASITKYSKTIFDPKDVIPETQRALEIALTPPYGPVHISVPTNIQLMPFEDILPPPIDISSLTPKYDYSALGNAATIIQEAKRGVIMVGRGARGLTEEIIQLSSLLQWPIITTASAKGIIPNNLSNNLGTYGWCSSEDAIHHIDNQDYDCLLILGSALGQMSTRVYNQNLIKDRFVIHIDWDKNELNRIFTTNLPVHHDLQLALPYLLTQLGNYSPSSPFNYTKLPPAKTNEHTGLSMKHVMEVLPDIVPDNTCFLQDMGENMNFTFKYLTLKDTMDFQVSIHHASMGTAVCGVLGSYMANPQRPYAVILGDGTFYMNGMEITTAMIHKMPIIYFVVNNGMLSLVEHGGQYVFGRSHKGASVYPKLSIKQMAQAMGVQSVSVEQIEDLYPLKELMRNLTEPLVVELITDGSEICMDTDRWAKK